MTRINAGVNPSELHRRHLIAEYREIPMVPAALRRSLRTRNELDILCSIPSQFTLNKGHVTFFYNKLAYLRVRYEMIKEEIVSRGYHINRLRDPGFAGFPTSFYGYWWADITEARKIVLERINQRISEKPHLYD